MKDKIREALHIATKPCVTQQDINDLYYLLREMAAIADKPLRLCEGVPLLQIAHELLTAARIYQEDLRDVRGDGPTLLASARRVEESLQQLLVGEGDPKKFVYGLMEAYSSLAFAGGENRIAQVRKMKQEEKKKKEGD